MSNTRTERHPEKYTWAKNWGWTHFTWPEFIKRFPKEAAAYAPMTIADWDPEEVQDLGGPDFTKWEALWDDECFTDRKGRLVIYANITGPGGYLHMGWNGEEWDEVLYDDKGNREGDPEYDY